MNKSQAAELLERLVDRTIDGYHLSQAVGTGATAAVYRATDSEGAIFAVKIYDAQFASEDRLNRELLLKGHDCPNLVKIIAGGEQTVEDTRLLFLVMEFVDGMELTKLRDRSTPIPDQDVRRLLRELCIASEYLLKKQLCHRDIKAQNIMLRATGELVLLDMGVLRPVGDSDLTQEGRNVATRRYSPPELQHRQEENNPLGFEALTVYQIGAVIFELIQRTKLFANVPDHPDATLSRAIDTEVPRFIGATVGSDLCELALRCLSKDWRKRPKMAELLAVAAATPPSAPSLMKARAERGRTAAAEIKAAQDAANAHLASLEKMATTAIELASAAIALPEATPPIVRIIPSGMFTHPGSISDTLLVGTYPKSLEAGFPMTLLIAVAVNTRAADRAVVAKGCGVYGDAFMPSAAQFPQIFASQTPGRPPTEQSQMLEMFEELWSLPLDAETFSRKIAEWTNKLVTIYFRQTDTYLTQIVDFQKAAAEARIKGERITVARGQGQVHQPVIFNTRTSKPIRIVSWKPAT